MGLFSKTPPRSPSQERRDWDRMVARSAQRNAELQKRIAKDAKALRASGKKR